MEFRLRGERRKHWKGRPKTKFEKFVGMDVCAEEDLVSERKFGKKLNIKDGKLGGAVDGLGYLMGDISTASKSKKKVEKVVRVSGKEGFAVTCKRNLATHVNGEALCNLPIKRSRPGNEEGGELRSILKGLLNRLVESNVRPFTAKIDSMFRLQSISRNTSSEIIINVILQCCTSEQLIDQGDGDCNTLPKPGADSSFAVLAAFVACIISMDSSVGIDFGAKLMASLAKTFEDEYLKEHNLSLNNLTSLLSYLFIFGVCSCDLIYDFLRMLSMRLTEIDITTIHICLQRCGMKIRGDDPTAMLNFFKTVQSRVDLLMPCTGEDHGKRLKFLLEDIRDIKNNKMRSGKDMSLCAGITKRLQLEKLRVRDICIRGLTWGKLLDPNKKGQWWLSGDITATSDNIKELPTTIDKEIVPTQEMLQLAISQGMNTRTRQAIFIVIMCAEDCIDALNKLIRLDIPGKEDRQITRVLVHCCLHEKVFNKYYTALASKLCEHDQNHKFSLQYCLWDHFKAIDNMQSAQSFNLAKFVADMLARFALTIDVLKIVDFSNVKPFTSKRKMHLRMLFDVIFTYPDEQIWNIFTRAAVLPELEALRIGIAFFCREYVVKRNTVISDKFKIAKKALKNLKLELL